jgi:hypothetical protein
VKPKHFEIKHLGQISRLHLTLIICKYAKKLEKIQLSIWIDIAVQAPAHSQVGGLLTYRSPVPVHPGQLVRVPFGQREVLGVVWAIRDSAPNGMPTSQVREVLGIL